VTTVSTADLDSPTSFQLRVLTCRMIDSSSIFCTAAPSVAAKAQDHARVECMKQRAEHRVVFQREADV
jgi:hypothetical protein